MNGDDLIRLVNTLRDSENTSKVTRETIRQFLPDPQLGAVAQSILETEDPSRRISVSPLQRIILRHLPVAALVIIGALLFTGIIGYYFGAASSPSTLIIFVIGGISILAAFAAHLFADFGKVWGNVEKVFTSGVFYFFAGLALLLYAIHTTNSREHPALTFLIAMLGVAVMLFGTGSQAVGSIATEPDKGGVGDWSPIKANAAVAGGAAVLTALFSWGVIHFKKDISEVFGNYQRYARIRIDACASLEDSCPERGFGQKQLRRGAFSFDKYKIDIKVGTRVPTYAYYSDDSLYLIVFPEDLHGAPFVAINLVQKPEARNSTSVAANDGPDELAENISIDLSMVEVFSAEESNTSSAEEATRRQKSCQSQNDNCKLAKMEDTTSFEEDRAESAAYTLNFLQTTRRPVAADIPSQDGSVKFR